MHHFFLGSDISKITEISPEKYIQRWAGTAQLSIFHSQDFTWFVAQCNSLKFVLNLVKHLKFYVLEPHSWKSATLCDANHLQRAIANSDTRYQQPLVF